MSLGTFYSQDVSSCDQVNFRKKQILANFRIIKNNNIISDAIIPTVAIWKTLLYHFFVTLQCMTVPYFMAKSIFLSGFTQGGGVIRQKHPGTDRAK